MAADHPAVAAPRAVGETMAKGRPSISSDQRQLINRAVAEAERACSAEFVPAITLASGRYDRAEDLAGFTLAVALFLATWILFQRDDPTGGGWDGLTIALQWPVFAAVLIGGYFFGIVVAANVWPIRRLFSPRGQMRDEVMLKARQVFYDARIHHTTSSAGVLFFVSLYERSALVIADERAMAGLGQSGLDALRDDLVSRLRRETPAAALASVIVEAGKRLAASLPSTATDSNELPDALVIVE